MREAFEKIKKKLYINSIGEPTEWKDGYAQGLMDAMEILEGGIDSLIVPNNNYYVIMYQNGDKHFPYVEKMRCYKVSEKNRKSYLFSRYLYANRANTKVPDLVLSNTKSLRERVFFTREQAERSIAE